jgi:hypothetical protein
MTANINSSAFEREFFMRTPGFTAAVALDGSRQHYYQAVTGAVAGTQGVVLPANIPSKGGGGVVVVNPPAVCPANPAVRAPRGACPADGSWQTGDIVRDCNYAHDRCACYGPTDPSGCCDYYDGHCLNLGPPGVGGNGGGGPVGGPPHHGPVLT